MQHLLSSKVLNLIYHAYVLPICDYCDTVWSPRTVKRERQLETYRTKATSLLTTSTSEQAGLSVNHSLKDCREYHTAVQIYNVLNKLSPSYLQDIFKYSVSVTNHIGRNKNHLFIPCII